MPRINIDDTLRNDPRFEKLSQEVGKPMAFGTLICLWDLGMAYWKQNKSLIPQHIFYNIDLASTLLRLGFVELRDGFVYCNGSEEHWKFLLSNVERGKAGGVASAQARKEKYGTNQPQKPKKQQKSSKLVEANRSTLPLPHPLPTISNSSSSEIGISAPAKAGSANKVFLIGEAYQKSYEQVYGYKNPEWGDKEFGQIKNWLKSVPFDEAMQIAKLYPHWKDHYVADKAHPLSLMITNTSKIMAFIKNPTKQVLRVLNAKESMKSITTEIKKETADEQYQRALKSLDDSFKESEQQIQIPSS